MAEGKKEKPRHLGRGLQSLLSPITHKSVESFVEADNPAENPNFPPDKELRDSLRLI